MEKTKKKIHRFKRSLLVGERESDFSVENNNLRVIVVSDRNFPFFKGGAEKRYWEIARNMVGAGFEFCFATGQWPGMEKQSQVDGITLQGVYKVNNFYVNGRKSISETLKYTFWIFRYLFLDNYDLIECEQFPLLPIFAAKIVSILRNKPLIVTWHEVWGRKQWLNYIGKLGYFGAWIEALSIKLPDHLISVSNQTTLNLRNKFDVPEERITTIPNGIDINWDRRNKNRSLRDQEQQIAQRSEDSDHMQDRRSNPENSDIIYVGRLLRHKNVNILLHAVANLSRLGKSAKLIVIGDGPEMNNLKDLSLSLGIEKNVQFLGFIENCRELFALMKASKVLVLPSTREGFEIVVIEANACGIPAIVIDHQASAASELILNGENGYICRLDHEEITNQIIQILNSPGSSYREACLREARKYSWKEVSNRVGGVYLKNLRRYGYTMQNLLTTEYFDNMP